MKTEHRFPGLLKVFLPAVLLLAVSCRQSLDMPPVVVSKASCVLTSQSGSFEHAGVTFRCRNTGDRQMVSLEVSFIVFSDASGGNPLYGSNVVTAEVAAVLQPGQTGTFEISLDDQLAYLPDRPFVIDYFYVRKVTFDDGTVWTDMYGLYHAGSTLP